MWSGQARCRQDDVIRWPAAVHCRGCDGNACRSQQGRVDRDPSASFCRRLQSKSITPLHTRDAPQRHCPQSHTHFPCKLPSKHVPYSVLTTAACTAPSTLPYAPKAPNAPHWCPRRAWTPCPPALRPPPGPQGRTAPCPAGTRSAACGSRRPGKNTTAQHVTAQHTIWYGTAQHISHVCRRYSLRRYSFSCLRATPAWCTTAQNSTARHTSSAATAQRGTARCSSGSSLCQTCRLLTAVLTLGQSRPACHQSTAASSTAAVQIFNRTYGDRILAYTIRSTLL